ncbi:MAG: hypothetical protein DID92_2727744053 [Candidatus Nitrotoga sp. SPKER]|nr:MAG: hypothetical protein DID92_2727744053 [Candidatus Nitrotoga sp. SPKER]
MLTTNEISRATNYVEELRIFTHGLKIPSDDKIRAAASCFAIAQDHHQAIVRLIEYQLFASVFSLVRIEFEAYIRGEWLSQCASDKLVIAFLKGIEPPRIDCMIEQLEKLEPFNENILSQIKQKNWRSMCAFTHTGGLHVLLWNTEDGIEPNYIKEDVIKMLNFAEIIASLAALAVAGLAGNKKLAVRILKALKRQHTVCENTVNAC